MEKLIMSKEVSQSLLKDGFSITVALQPAFYALTGETFVRGQSKMVTLIIDGKPYSALLKNQIFDQNKHVGHTDIVQIRYSSSSPISQKFREIFNTTYDYVCAVKAQQTNKKTKIKIPVEYKEQLLLYATDQKDVFLVDYVLAGDRVDDLFSYTNEEQFETPSIDNWTDPNASIEVKEKLIKIRKIDHSICNNLKMLYDYRCQISGEKIGEDYGGYVVEAHHLVPFVESQNNDASNLIVISPNFHRIIHKFKPSFDRKKKLFRFENGIEEKVTVDLHL